MADPAVGPTTTQVRLIVSLTVPPHPVPDSINLGSAAIRARQQREAEQAEQEAQLQRLEVAHAAHLQALAQDPANAIMRKPPCPKRPMQPLQSHYSPDFISHGRRPFLKMLLILSIPNGHKNELGFVT